LRPRFSSCAKLPAPVLDLAEFDLGLELFPKAGMRKAGDIEALLPGEALENFRHGGEFKTSRKSGVFQPIAPLTPADIAKNSIEDMGFHDLLANIQKMREELKSKIAELTQHASDTDAENQFFILPSPFFISRDNRRAQNHESRRVPPRHESCAFWKIHATRRANQRP
jgi:hypothetical protein